MTIEEFLRAWLMMKRDELDTFKAAGQISSFSIDMTMYETGRVEIQSTVEVPHVDGGEKFRMTTTLEHFPAKKED